MGNLFSFVCLIISFSSFFSFLTPFPFYPFLILSLPFSLPFSPTQGEIIEVLSREEVNWWYGRKRADGKEGYFPVDYVRDHYEEGFVPAHSEGFVLSLLSFFFFFFFFFFLFLFFFFCQF